MEKVKIVPVDFSSYTIYCFVHVQASYVMVNLHSWQVQYGDALKAYHYYYNIMAICKYIMFFKMMHL
jgi:hypothetical protein